MKKYILTFLIIASISATAFILVSSRNQPTGTTTTSTALQQKEGIVTKIAPNCQQAIILQNGKPTMSDEPILCDAGGYITIGDTKIQYASGKVAYGAFAYDIRAITVGDTVRATYTLGEDGSFPTLNCKDCKVTVVMSR